MARYAAFLRGINVGGHRVKSPGLCAGVEALGFREVSAFRASGNLVLEAGEEPEQKAAARIEKGLAAALGYEVATFLRAEDELRKIATAKPFSAAETRASKGRLQVTMLRAGPDAKSRRAVLAMASEEDRLAFGDCELFWLPSGGTQQAALDLKAIDKLLGPSTMRTKGTVEQIVAKFFDS